MVRQLILTVVLLFAVHAVHAQVRPVTPVKDSVVRDSARARVTDTTRTRRVDTLKAKYINPGKIAGRKAMLRSAILPGMGQIGNGVTVYRLAKVAGIYVGATLLTLSYIDNSNLYKEYSKEILARADEEDDLQPDRKYISYPTSGLITAKGVYQRNREVIVFSFVGLYLLNIAEAYIDARLKYWDVGDVAIKVKPGLIDTRTMYGFNSMAPGLKITIAL